MDELSEEDKLTVSRARKVQRFMSQPFQVAEVFTGYEGKFVTLEDTIRVSEGLKDDQRIFGEHVKVYYAGYGRIGDQREVVKGGVFL